MSQAAGPSRTTKTSLNELWNDAIKKFHKSVAKSDLNKHEARALKDTIEELRRGASEAGSSFNSSDQNKFFSINSESFIQRLSVILEIGDKVMSAAPSEIASLVWMGVSLVGRIFVEGEKYTKRMEEGTHKMIEVVLICEVYARRHVQGHVEDEFEGTTQSTHNLITDLLSQVLEFFHIMTKHFESKNGGRRSRILTFPKAYFSTKCQKLLDISDEAMKTVNSLQRTATINFEAATLKLLRNVRLRPEKLRKLEQMTIDICKSIEIRFGKIQDNVSELAITRKSTAIGEKLKSWGIEDTDIQIRKYHEKIEQRYKNSCRWIFDQRKYQSWKSKERGILWLSGGGGVGKSTLMSTVVESFVKETKSQATATTGDNPIILHFFCRLGNRNSEIAWRIMLYLCVQLFEKATDSISGNTPLDLRSDCNDAAEEFIQERFPSSLEISTLHSFFANLEGILNRPILIVVDALDECTQEEQLLRALESISASKMKVRVIASSRNQPPLRIEHIQIDTPGQTAKTYADVKAFVSGSLKDFDDEWNVEGAIISKAQGMFKYARIAIDSLINVPEGVFTDLEAFSRDLPNGINGLYQRKINDLSADGRRVLITALRWLVCGGDKIQLLPIADELCSTYKSKKATKSGGQLALRSRGSVEEVETKQVGRFASGFRDVGRDFLRVNGTTLHLEHNSIRDFVNSYDRLKFQADAQDEIASAIAEAGEKEGHSLMAEHILKTLNSPGFQDRFLSSKAVEKYKDTTRRSIKVVQLRYEIVNWQRHVRKAEEHRARYESRWNTILCEAKRFLSSTGDSNNAYINWLKLKSTPDDDRSGDSPLHVAARYGLFSLMEMFTSDDLRNKGNNNGDIPLHTACSGHSGFVGIDMLLRPSNVNIRNKNGATPLLIAIRNNARLSVVKKLLERKADPTLADNNNTTCLHLAASAQNRPVCEALLKYPTVKVNAMDKRRETPLHFACKKPNSPRELVELLLEKGADPNAQDKDSRAPLFNACRAGNDQVAKLLLQKQADINDDDVWGNTALHGAISAGNKRAVELLIDWNAKKLERVSKAGQIDDHGRENSHSPIHEKWNSQASDAAQTAKAINIFARNNQLRDGVAHSAFCKEYKIMELLIDTHGQRRSDMGFLLKTDKNGKIPLHYCIDTGNKDAVQKLLQAGKAHGKTKIDEPLDQKMCKVQTASGNQSLHIAAWRGQSSIVKILLAHGAQKDSLCSAFPRYIRYGKTPLDAAFGGWQEFGFTDVKLSQSFEDVIKSLFPHGIDLSEKSRKFVCALERNSKTIFDLLRPWNEYKDPYGWPCMLVAAEYGLRIPEGNATRYDNVPRNTSPPNRWGYGDKRLNISADGLVASCDPTDPSKKFHMSVRANNPVQPGTKLFYFEIEILQSDSEKPVIGVGFCSRLAPIVDVLPGSIYARALTWGYRGDNGKIYSWNHEEGRTFNARFGAGDVIGCGLNLTNSPGKRSIYYTKNGKLLGTAFRDVKGQLFPVLGIEGQSSKVAVRANFGNDAKRPFKYKHPNQS